jgi:hypothetical protein
VKHHLWVPWTDYFKPWPGALGCEGCGAGLSRTFANFNDQATFANLLAQVGIDRIMFFADDPFGSMAEGLEFLDALPISADDRKLIAHKSARSCFACESAGLLHLAGLHSRRIAPSARSAARAAT